MTEHIREPDQRLVSLVAWSACGDEPILIALTASEQPPTAAAGNAAEYFTSTWINVTDMGEPVNAVAHPYGAACGG